MSLPQRLGRLRRVDRLGVGGFSSVWLYRDDELRSDVAVKALADNWAQREDVRERFLEEARILRAADSDHVVRVYDIGEADGTPYFVMTYADRGTVADLLKEGRADLERTVVAGPPGRRRARGAARQGRGAPRHQAAEPAAGQRRARPRAA